jgi:quercetin dioxygenase-like cupin family protein
MQVNKAGARSSTPADPARYSGEVWTDALIEGGPPGHINVARVAFSPGARTAWHTHPYGQILVAISGIGLVCRAGGPAIRLRAGDNVAIEPSERHWHGATPDHAFSHYAIQGADGDGRMAVWQDLVTDDDYRNAAARVRDEE